jgi:hypothetical protein
MSNYEIVSLLILSVSALFVGVTLIYLSKQIKLFISAHADNHDWNRRIETQHALDNVREVNTDSLNKKFGYINRKDPILLDEILQAFEEEHSLQLLLHKLLNFYEGLANGVFLGMYDEVSIKASRKEPMEREFIRFKLYIDYRRNQSSKTAWIAYERLVKKWKEELLRSADRTPTGEI